MPVKKKLLMVGFATLLLSLLAGVAIGNAFYADSHPQTPNAVRLVDQAAKDKTPAVLVFWLKGCPYCNKALPTIIKKADQHRTTKTIYVEINSPAGKTLSKRYGVTKVPAMVKVSEEHIGTPQLVTTGNAANNTIHVNASLIATFYKNIN